MVAVWSNRVREFHARGLPAEPREGGHRRQTRVVAVRGLVGDDDGAPGGRGAGGGGRAAPRLPPAGGPGDRGHRVPRRADPRWGHRPPPPREPLWLAVVGDRSRPGRGFLGRSAMAPTP